MKIRTIDQVIRIMDDDRVWRIREISMLRSQFSRAEAGDVLRGVLRRSFIPIAYAHWEGYVKRVGQSYLEYVATQRLKLSELSPCFQSLYLTLEFQSDIKRSRRHSLQGVLSKISKGQNDRVHIRTKDVISTQGNLNSDVLSDVCMNLGFDLAVFDDHLAFIDKILLARRNAVAHGDAVLVDDKMADEVHRRVVNCIDLFKGLASDSLLNKRFKAAA